MCYYQDSILGRLAQLARAPALQAGGQRFESSNAHMRWKKGRVAQLVRVPACHAGGREFESRHARLFCPRVDSSVGRAVD